LGDDEEDVEDNEKQLSEMRTNHPPLYWLFSHTHRLWLIANGLAQGRQTPSLITFVL
jgi:uncharacterized membrane protein